MGKESIRNDLKNQEAGEKETVSKLPIEITSTSLIHPTVNRLLETLDFKPSEISKETKGLRESMPIKELLSKYDTILNDKKISEKLLEKRCIIGDIVHKSEDWTTKFYCKYWWSILVNNINSFINICCTHAFFPMVDRIIIDGHDITSSAFNDYFKDLIMEINNLILRNILINETLKIEKSTQILLKNVKTSLDEITWFTTETTKFILWKKFEKIKNIWPLSENLFVEIAARLENKIREFFWFRCSYMQVAWHRDDAQRKTDMYHYYKRTIYEKSKIVPIQFTYWKKSKEHDVETYLRDHKDEHREKCFMIISVQWKFKEWILHDNLLWKYKSWLDNPEEREILTEKRFPLFIDLVDQKIIQPAEIIYIALHIICREEFKMTFLEGKWFIWDKWDEKFLHNEEHTINWINLDNISIEYVRDGEKSEKSKNKKRRKKNKDSNKIDLWSISKRKYVIKYNKTKMWTIIMYEW